MSLVFVPTGRNEELGIGNGLQATGWIEFGRGDTSQVLDMSTPPRFRFEVARGRSSVIDASFLQGAALTRLA